MEHNLLPSININGYSYGCEDICPYSNINVFNHRRRLRTKALKYVGLSKITWTFLITYNYTTRFHSNFQSTRTHVICSSMQNFIAVPSSVTKLSTFATMEHSDDVSDVDAKTLILNQKLLFRATDFYSLTAQSMLKDCLTIGAWFNLPICIKFLMYCLDLRINLDWA